MPFTKFTNLNFDQIKESVKDYLRANSDFKDFDFEGSNMAIIIDILAYNSYITAFNSNMVANESFLDSATLRENVVSLARNIGYVPRSRKSAEAVVDFEYKFNGDSNTITLKKGLALVGAVNNTSYTFSIPEDVTVNSPLDSGGVGGNNSPRTGKFSGLTVYQGTLLTKKFIVNGSSDQRFILDNSFIDLDSLRVEVRKSGSSGGLAFSRVDNIIEVTPVSNVFLIQEIKNETYELLFGDGLFGKKLEIGDVIDISYIVTDGKDGNEGKFFTFSGNMVNDAGTSIASTNNVQVIATQTARNGTDIEPIDSIRYFAPRMYSAQNRAVTPRDYEAIIQSIYPNTESVSVVGGEELDPPEFGTVVLSIKPKNGTFLSDFTKQNILNKLKQYAIAGINQRIEDLKILYVELESFVYYNNSITDDQDQLKAEVITSLTEYGKSTNLNAFGGRFKYSESQRIIDQTDPAITSNITKVTIRRDLKALIDQSAQYELCFGNQFNVKPGGGTIKSTGFSISGIEGEVYLTDIPRSNNLIGDIAVFKPAVSATEDPVVVVGSAGIVDYVKGEVILNTIKISSTVKDNNIVEIQAFPESNDIIGLKDIYLNLDISNTEINIVRDTISSGQQISGIGYKVTSSYSNGSLIRQ
mgnify:CR=1 FL=1|tara:strand:+ start:881 stop:2800 length:1920 start_codon:yes stop_codon:yes gene_type:complete